MREKIKNKSSLYKKYRDNKHSLYTKMLVQRQLNLIYRILTSLGK